VGDLAAAVVAADPELRDELRGLVADIVGHMRYTMKHGEPASKIALTKTIIPQLLGAINKVEKSEEQDGQRAAYERMLAAVRGDVGVDAGNGQGTRV
jgi:hypothetical protein